MQFRSSPQTSIDLGLRYGGLGDIEITLHFNQFPLLAYRDTAALTLLQLLRASDHLHSTAIVKDRDMRKFA